MKLRLTFLFILSLSVAAKGITFDPDKNFSTGHFDLESYFTKEEKKIIEQDKYSTGLKNFTEFIETLSQYISQEDLTYFTLETLITEVVRLIGERSIFITNQCHVLNGFLTKTPELDCDTTAITVYCILYRLQAQYPYYQILENFYLACIVGHAMGVIQKHEEFFYTDLNIALEEGFELRFISKTDYCQAYQLKKAALKPVKGEALKELVLYGIALDYYQQQDHQKALDTLTEALSFNPEGIASLCCKAHTEYFSGHLAQACQTLETLAQREQLDVSLFCIWALAYLKQDLYEPSISVMDEAIASSRAINPYYHLIRAEAYAAIAKKELILGQDANDFLPQLRMAIPQKNAMADYSLALNTLNDCFYSQVELLKTLTTHLKEFVTIQHLF